MIAINTCSSDQALLYMRMYFATVDLMREALYKYDALASNGKTVAVRSLYKAKALEAERDIELLANKRRAFLSGIGSMSPPTQAMVDITILYATQLSKILAKEASGAAIITFATNAINAFNEIQP